jgi:hypothetical protein
MSNGEWPALRFEDWKETLATVHMWTQVVGKIALRHALPENHSWAIAMQMTPRGLATRTLFYGTRPFSFEFDFLDHTLVLTLSDQRSATLALEPMTVAAFHAAVMRMCADAGLPVTIWTMPVEIPDPVKFEDDTIHGAYDAEAIERFHRVLRQVDRVFRRYRAGFVGKCSPVHFFWGAFDLAVTRFSGKPAPRREGPAFMVEAYSHEVISHGFWPGSQQFPQAALYAYAVPEPEGFKQARVAPEAAIYHQELGEFLLPYDAVRSALDPERAILEFMNTTYDEAARLGGWDRAALEVPDPSSRSPHSAKAEP